MCYLRLFHWLLLGHLYISVYRDSALFKRPRRITVHEYTMIYLPSLPPDMYLFFPFFFFYFAITKWNVAMNYYMHTYFLIFVHWCVTSSQKWNCWVKANVHFKFHKTLSGSPASSHLCERLLPPHLGAQQISKAVLTSESMLTRALGSFAFLTACHVLDYAFYWTVFIFLIDLKELIAY